MSHLPQVSGEHVVRALKRIGFFIHHKKGSHFTLRHAVDKSKRTVVPVHKGKTLGKGLLLSIIKDAGLSVEEFKDLL